MDFLNVGNMEFNNRKSVNSPLKNYDHLCNYDDFIEITEWTNGEGYDISIETKSNTKFYSLTHGELEAINHLTKSLEYNDHKD